MNRVWLRGSFFQTGCIISLQSNSIITDTEGTIESVRFKRVEFIAGGVRTTIAMHCGFKIFKMAAKVEKFRRLYALFHR